MHSDICKHECTVTPVGHVCKFAIRSNACRHARVPWTIAVQCHVCQEAFILRPHAQMPCAVTMMFLVCHFMSSIEHLSKYAHVPCTITVASLLMLCTITLESCACVHDRICVIAAQRHICHQTHTVATSILRNYKCRHAHVPCTITVTSHIGLHVYRTSPIACNVCLHTKTRALQKNTLYYYRNTRNLSLSLSLSLSLTLSLKLNN